MNFLEQLLNCIPPHRLKGTVEVYSSKNIVIFKPKIFFKGPLCSNNYQFVLPLCAAPSFTVEKKIFPVEKNKIFPINPDQIHGTLDQCEVKGYFSILIKKEMIQEMAHSTFGRADIRFNNDFAGISNDTWNLINSFVRETAERQMGFEFMQEGIGLQLVMNLLRQVKSNIHLEKNNFVHARDNIKKAIEFLNDCYNKDFRFEEIARIANLSPYHFIRVFKAEIGMTPYEYLLNIKIQKVKEKLANRNLSISQVFSECGMDYNGHFAALFKRKVGVTPSQYRKEIMGCHL